ncbi:hypothetical protein V8C86DRAFT_1308974 [Haematococcus lacustris]
MLLGTRNPAVCSAFNSPPLITPELAFSKQTQVRTFLDEPILARPDLRKLVALCAIADALVERASRLEDVRPYDVQILQETEAACKELYPERSAQETLEALNLLEMFPYLEQGLVSGRLEVVASSQGSSYLSYVSLLNQLVLMSTQMYHDACNPQHHKYMAHQMALLYQCLNQLQGDTKPLRRAIESRFDDIKRVTESADPTFDLEQSEWLQNLAAHCHIEGWAPCNTDIISSS